MTELNNGLTAGSAKRHVAAPFLASSTSRHSFKIAIQHSRSCGREQSISTGRWPGRMASRYRNVAKKPDMSSSRRNAEPIERQPVGLPIPLNRFPLIFISPDALIFFWRHVPPPVTYSPAETRAISACVAILRRRGFRKGKPDAPMGASGSLF